MSYNGAKFDNHFILRGFKVLYPLEWSQRLKITGSFSNIKIMQFGNIVFHDLLLMTGAACSLSKLAESMKIHINKLDLKIAKVAATYEMAQKNRDLIEAYCKRDTDLLYFIYEKFKTSMCEVVMMHCSKFKQNKRLQEYLLNIDLEVDCQFDELDIIAR